VPRVLLVIILILDLITQIIVTFAFDLTLGVLIFLPLAQSISIVINLILGVFNRDLHPSIFNIRLIHFTVAVFYCLLVFSGGWSLSNEFIYTNIVLSLLYFIFTGIALFVLAKHSTLKNPTF
jgi:hypothetical protein